mgnify:CR=1 FL=1
MEDKNDLWSRYRKEPSKEIKEKIVMNYAPLIKASAYRLYQGLPGNVELDDLLAYGSLGLLDAIDRYNPELSDKFEPYAMLRIRGAMIDGLRKMDWANQSSRRKAKEIEKAYTFLEQKLGRSATDQEVADYLGLTVKEFEQLLQEVGSLSVISLEQPLEKDEHDLFTLGDLLVDKSSPDPLDNLENLEIKDYLSKAIAELNEKERLVITLYYYEELSIKEISKILELSEGRISQIHKKAVLKLKGKLQRFLNL